MLKRTDLDVNRVHDWTKNTPLMIAVGQGHTEIVELLLNDERTKREKVDHLGKTALDTAKQNGKDLIIGLFESDKNTFELKGLPKPPALSQKDICYL